MKKISLLSSLCLVLFTGCQSADSSYGVAAIVWNRDNCLLPAILDARDFKQLFFLEESTLARGNLYWRYICRHVKASNDCLLESSKFPQRDNDTFLILEIIDKGLDHEQAWDLLEFYMCYQSKEYNYFSTIYTELERRGLLKHPRAAIMLKYKPQMDKLAKQDKQLVNLAMFREIRARHEAQGIVRQDLKFGDARLRNLSYKEKMQLAQFIIRAHDWRKLTIEQRSLKPKSAADEENMLFLDKYFEKILLPALRKSAPQWVELLSEIDKDSHSSYTLPRLAQFVIEEWLSLYPHDKAAWDFVDHIFPLGDGEVMYADMLFEALENQHLLISPKGSFYMRYDVGFGSPSAHTMSYKQFVTDLLKRAQRKIL